MARKERYLVGLDVGTSKITAIVGEMTDHGGLDIIGMGLADSRGIRRGVVVNLEAAVESIKKAIDEAAVDPLCTDPNGPKRRMILVPDPKLDVPFAAAAWGATLRLTCLDEVAMTALKQFMVDQYAKSPENFCADGVDIQTLPADQQCEGVGGAGGSAGAAGSSG